MAVSNFGKAFRAARAKGLKTFMWNGKSYTTQTKEESTPPIPKDRPKAKTGITVGGRGSGVAPRIFGSVFGKPITKGGNTGNKVKPKSNFDELKAGGEKLKTTPRGPNSRGGAAKPTSKPTYDKVQDYGAKAATGFTKGGNSGNKTSPEESMSALGIKLGVKKKNKAKLSQ